MKRIGKIVAAIGIPLAVGCVSALLTSDAMQQFESLNQPPLSPPGWLFPVTWTVLYVLMGLASYLVFDAKAVGEAAERSRRIALGLYGLQLFFNFCWSPLFFVMKQYYFAFFWLLVMWGLILALLITAGKLDRRASILLLPYLLWTTFAGYLNIMVAILN